MVPQVRRDAELDRVISEVVPHVLRLHVLEPDEVQLRGQTMKGEVQVIVDQRTGYEAGEDRESSVVGHEKPNDDRRGYNEPGIGFKAERDAVLLVHEHVVREVTLEDLRQMFAVGWTFWVEVRLRVQSEAVLAILDKGPDQAHAKEQEVEDEVICELLDGQTAGV